MARMKRWLGIVVCLFFGTCLLLLRHQVQLSSHDRRRHYPLNQAGDNPYVINNNNNNNNNNNKNNNNDNEEDFVNDGMYGFAQVGEDRIKKERNTFPRNLQPSSLNTRASPSSSSSSSSKCLHKTKYERCELIHISMVAGGHATPHEMSVMLKSLLYHRQNSHIHMHLYVDKLAHLILKTLFSTWRLKHVDFFFYKIEPFLRNISWIPNKHYSGVYGLIKLIIPSTIHPSVKKLLILDSDLTFNCGVEELWRLFEEFEGPQALGLVENQSDWYVDVSKKPWPAIGRGYNTGMMLVKVPELLAHDWGGLWASTANQTLATLHATSLADQDIVNTLLLYNTPLLHVISCGWNLQLCQAPFTPSCVHNASVTKIIHWNSPNKVNLNFKNTQGSTHFNNNNNNNNNTDDIFSYLPDFRKLYFSFQEMDGSYVRKNVFGCRKSSFSSPSSSPSASLSSSSSLSSPSSSSSSSSSSNEYFAPLLDHMKNGLEVPTTNNNNKDEDDDECSGLRAERYLARRTHAYSEQYDERIIIRSDDDFVHGGEVEDNGGGEVEDDDADDYFMRKRHYLDEVTLVTQLSVDRIYLMVGMASRWPGPISVAIYLTDAQVKRFKNMLTSSEVLSNRKNIGYHLVFEEGEYFPINSLRNVAWMHSNTRYLFLSDVDFLPSHALYPAIKNHLKGLHMHKKALVVPVFETERYKTGLPSNKQQLLSMLKQGHLFTFRYHEWQQGQMATDYDKWFNASQPYAVPWQANYEPFIVVERHAPMYDTSFVGFGWNKVSHVMHLDADGYEFWVLPDVFSIHLPHSPSHDIYRYRSESDYRECLRRTKEDFLKRLSLKYGIRALKYLSPDS